MTETLQVSWHHVASILILGIPEADLAAIQSPFYRTQYAEQQTEGAGLGLALTQRLLNLMGSELHAKLLYDFLHKHYQTVANFDADKSKSIATRRKPKFYKKKGAT